MVTVPSYSPQSAFSPSSSQMAVLSDKPAGVTDEEWLSKHFPPVEPNVVPVPTPSPALAEQMNLGARAFAEFNDTLVRLMDYGLIATWAERNVLREEELGLPLSGWTGTEATSPAVSARSQPQVGTSPIAGDDTQVGLTTTAIAGAADTEPTQSVQPIPVPSQPPTPSAAQSSSSAAGSIAGVSPPTVETMTVASVEAAQSTSSTDDQLPVLPVSPSVAQQGSGAAATSDAPLATTSSTEAAPATPNAAAPPGPLPSLSSLTTASSHSSSSWIAPNSWYVSDELYAVRRAATEQYRQMHLGTLQKTLFDEA